MTARTYTEDDIRTAFTLGYLNSAEGNNGEHDNHDEPSWGNNGKGQWEENTEGYLRIEKFRTMADAILERRFGIRPNT